LVASKAGASCAVQVDRVTVTIRKTTSGSLATPKERPIVIGTASTSSRVRETLRRRSLRGRESESFAVLVLGRGGLVSAAFARLACATDVELNTVGRLVRSRAYAVEASICKQSVLRGRRPAGFVGVFTGCGVEAGSV